MACLSLMPSIAVTSFGITAHTVPAQTITAAITTAAMRRFFLLTPLRGASPLTPARRASPAAPSVASGPSYSKANPLSPSGSAPFITASISASISSAEAYLSSGLKLQAFRTSFFRSSDPSAGGGSGFPLILFARASSSSSVLNICGYGGRKGSRPLFRYLYMTRPSE